MKFLFLALCISLNVFAEVKYKGEFPTGPDADLTPGSLCDRPDAYRYSERIPYCNRNVDSSLKADIFQEYRLNGYRLDPKKRQDYKIDHLIPLCAGGSNREDNLWPQHKTVYELTDALESVGCEKMKAGALKQAEFIKRLLAAKKDLSLVDETLEYLNSL